jgi:hypothetical protein
MASYASSDKSFGGTPGLLFRLRLELGIGTRSLKSRRTLMHSIHSEQRAMFPVEVAVPEGCKETLPDLIQMNETVLDDLIDTVMGFGDDVPVPPETEAELTRLMDHCEKRIDEIMFRGKLIERVRAEQGPALP